MNCYKMNHYVKLLRSNLSLGNISKLAKKTTLLYPLLLLVTVAFFSSCVRTPLPPVFTMNSDLEVLSKNKANFLANNDSIYQFKGGAQQTTLRHKSGTHSAFSTPKSAFILSKEIADVYRDSYVDIEVWKQGENAHLVCFLPETRDYFSTDEVVETDSNGWQKLHLTFYLPPVKEYYQHTWGLRYVATQITTRFYFS